MSSKPTLQEKLSELRRQEEEARTKELANKLNLPYLDFLDLSINPEGLTFLPEETAQKSNLIVIDKHGRELKVALSNPKNNLAQKTLEDLKKQGFNYRLFLISQSSLKQALERYKQVYFTEEKPTGEMEIAAGLVSEFQKAIKTIDDLKTRLNEMPPAQTSDLLELIISGALNLDASDVHIEPKEFNSNLKYRLDGLLHQITVISSKAYNLLLSRIKLLSGMKLNVRDIGQDGRFTIKLPRAEIEVRSSVIPGNYGESIVLRLLNPKTIGLNLEDLGFREDALAIIEQEIKRSNGLIITTGPTGSGKTTTLYAFLKKVTKPEVKIITLEDPIEYHLTGITQTQVDPKVGYDFSSGLRSILRQDPDILLVGEIRDTETAKTTLNASLTGHLVFSTLHTNDAAGAIPRLIDLGVDAGSLSSSLNLMMAQRLVRRLCPNCKEPHTPPQKILDQIEKALQGIKHPAVNKSAFFGPNGCDICGGIGYKGRIAVLELVQVDDEVEKLINSAPSHAQVLEFAKQKGMITMYQDALLKILAGVTTLEEVERVIT